MKKLTFLFCMMLVSAFTFSQWTWQNPLPQGNSLLSTFFTSSSAGYAVGYHGTILKTTDGGNSWNQQTSGTENSLNSVYFTSADTGYIAGGYSGKLILKTTDAGNNWSVQYSDSTLPSSLSSIYFVNSNLGFAVGYNGTILKTTDGGTTWTLKFSGTTSPLSSVFFTDANTGFVAGSNGLILKTINAGNSWSSLTTGTIYSINSLYFTDINTGYAVTGTEILKTINGGTTWTSYSVGTGNRLMSIHFTDLNNGCTVSEFGRIYKTNDAGITWTEQTSSTTNWLMSVFFTDNNTGYSVGNYGTIIKTTDGGINWNTLTIGITKNLFSVFFTENNTGYTVGTDGITLKTTNGGSNWIQMTSGTTDTLRSLYFTDVNTGFAVGNNGTIIKTTDAGNTWTTQTTGVFYNLHSVFMIDSNTGYAVGKNGMIVKTTNGGSTWDPLSFNVYGNLNSVYFTNSNTGYAVGAYGTIIKTTDGGNTWTVQASGTDHDLHSIYFTDNNTGHIVGIAGTILKTIDGGNNWLTYISGMNYWLLSVYFTDSITGYTVGIGGYGGVIYKTTDGGNVWNAESSISHNGFSSVYVTSSGCYAVGEYGTIISNAIIQPPCNVSFQYSASPSGDVDFTAITNVTDSLAYPILYTWSYGDGTSATTSFDTISHVYNSSGFVACVTMQTANGCTSSFCDSVSIGNPCTLVVTTTSTQPTPGQCDGSITAVSSGGTPPYAYFWSIGATTSTITNLCIGTYNLTVTDADGCLSYAYVVLNDTTNLNCNAMFLFDINPNGIIQFYDSSWATDGITAWNWMITDSNQNVLFTSTDQNPAATINITGYIYVTLTITSTNGLSCTYTSMIYIQGTSPCTFTTYMKITPVSVIGGNDGAIDLTVTGGTPPYSFIWSTGATTEDISGLYSGNYTVMVFDSDSLCSGISLTGYIYEPYDTTGGNFIIDTLTAPILDTCLNFVPDSFYISQIDIINYNTVVVTWVFEYAGQTQTIEASYTFGASGNYMVTLTINCGSKVLTTYSSYIHINAPLGIADVISDENISVFPNPASSFFNIDATPPYNYTVTSISGQVVYSSASETGHSTVNSSNLPAGIYFVRIENSVSSYVSKIIITR